MRTNPSEPKNIDEYIAGFPKDVQGILKKIRSTIRKAAPGAEETIKYRMPTFTLKGNLVHFAAFKNHIGFYPVPTGIKAFKKELSVYEGGKGSVQFPLDKPIPYDLISRIVKFRVKENLKKAEAKGKGRTKQAAGRKSLDHETRERPRKSRKRESVLSVIRTAGPRVAAATIAIWRSERPAL